MKENLHRYRLAGISGGLMLAAGQFVGPLCLLQAVALLPLMLLVLRERRKLPVLLAGFYMGIAYTLPQMIYLCMPVVVTVILLLWLMMLLTLLCVAVAVFLPRHPVFGPLAIGAVWYILDWINYTAVPIWGMAQSFSRSWTAYPFAIQFISITSVTGVLLVIGAAQGFVAWQIVFPQQRRQPAIAMITLFAIILVINSIVWYQKPVNSLRVAAAGWVFDDKHSEIDPHKTEGFKKLFEIPAKEAAAQGARIFNTGEMGFYIAAHERDEWMQRFSTVAKETGMWLVVGYFNLGEDENRVFFMNPQGSIVHEYTKTYKTPLEPGKKGNGDLKTIDVDGVTVGAMICHDDNYSKMTRTYGKLKADIVLCPTMDWRTVNTAHLQAVRARAIECNIAIARGADCGTSAAISNRGTVLAKKNHYTQGPGFVIADLPIRNGKTLFARFGHWPSLIISLMLVLMAVRVRFSGVGKD